MSTGDRVTALKIPLVFGLTLFTSALLLFWVEPLIGKMMLPLLGGSPAVWNTCMFFFQVLLLAGYAYAHFVSRWLPPGAQVAAQLVLLLLAALFLPITITPERINALSNQADPLFWLLGTLAGTIGLPFFVLSTSAPLFQRWFSYTSHSSAKDPYFLYAASNLGSLLVLLAFPIALEPMFRIPQQSLVWAGLFAGFILLVSLSGVFVFKGANAPLPTPKTGAGTGAPGSRERMDGRRRVKWILLAFAPSSLLLGVTTYLTTDIAALPLLWVLPLALYLLTFVLVFGKNAAPLLSVSRRILPGAVLALLFLKLSQATEPAWVLVLCHLAFFLVASLVCHGRLAEDRPAPRHLTDFYFCMSIGGVLGGFFNALLAPVLFPDIWEYPIVIVLACMLVGGGAVEQTNSWAWARRYLLPLAPGFLSLLLIWGIPAFTDLPAAVRPALVFGVPLVICYFLTPFPRRFGIALGAVILASSLQPDPQGKVLARERDFFGVSRVTRDEQQRFHQIYHGNTIHGRQFIDPARRCEALSYYHRTGPLGAVFEAFRATQSTGNVGVIGLGSGIIATYSRPGDRWTIYEIDPLVVRFARNTNYFTYLEDCAKARFQIVLGDARLRLQQAPTNQFHLLILDAFSSDAIPVHLITREALQVYVNNLAEGGVLAWHISNRFLSLEEVVGDLAASVGLTCYVNNDLEVDPHLRENGKEPSQWVVMARKPEDLGALTQNPRWKPLLARKNPQVWTDDFSHVFSVFKWQ